MTNHDRLMERYEDAMFALVMDKIAMSEGEEYLELNRRLKNDRTARVPEKVMRRSRRAITGAFRRARFRSAARSVYNAVNKGAMIFLVLSVVFVTAFTSSADLRGSMYQLVMKAFDDHFEYRFEGAPGEVETQRLAGLDVGWVPEGFALVDEGSNRTTAWKEYQNDSGTDLLIYVIALSTYGVDTIDQENATVSYEDINGMTAAVIRGVDLQVVIPLEESAQMIHLNVSDPDFLLDSVKHIVGSLTVA